MEPQIIDEVSHIDSLENFKEKIKKGINVIFFSAVWNQTGQRTEVEIEKISTKYNDKIQVHKVDIDEAMEIPIDLGMISFPTTAIYKNNDLIELYAGYVTETTLSNKIDTLF